MPTYVYHCSTCNQTFEAFHRMSDKPLTTCTCGSEGTVERQMSVGSGVIFKGSGFYQTDYKSSGSSSSSASASSETKPSTSSTTTSSGEGSCGSGGCSNC